MPFKFNPFSGNFDQTGSGGGGGASYIDGEVQNFSALPETVGSPAVDSAYLVREAEGTWLINRKPAGIYIRTANTGVRADDWTHAGAFPDVFNDANFLLYDSADSTKNLAFQLSGITTGTTRTLTAPNANGTIARTEDFAAPPQIGNVTPNSGAFTTLTANNGTITSSTPCLTLSQTWNAAAQAFHLCTIEITNSTPWTDSAASSTLFRVRYGGNNAFTVGYTGNVTSSGTVSAISGYVTNGTYQMSSNVTMGAGTGQTWDVWTSSALKLRLWNLGSPSSATNFERANLRWDSNEFIIDVSNGGTGTLRGIKIGSATSSLLGFYGATPVDRPATVADPAGGGTVDTEARTAINDIIDRLQELGLIA